MANPNYYAVIPADVRYDKDLTANAKLLYGEITALASATGECWASNKYFSELFGVTKTSIINWLNQLADKGYITVTVKNVKESRTIRTISVNTFTAKEEKTAEESSQGLTEETEEAEGGVKKSLPMGKNNFTGGVKKFLPNNNTSINNININKYIVEFLNEKAGTKYRYTTDSTVRKIQARLKEGYTEEDFKQVIETKVAEWKGTDMEKYLRPETLFGTKFESYLNQKRTKRKELGTVWT